ncbi:MAG: hypothetical protein Ct9H90mP28_4290 [Paracoccaceae bacterium]|nr:hypothetical protein [Verrucomicrobiales bacterium]GIS52713.1 MAG: hypothetical protein Ct9H90mP28_4290 [Paracoccaceae bacterium]
MSFFNYIELSKSVNDIFPQWNSDNMTDAIRIQLILDGSRNRPGDRNTLGCFLRNGIPIPTFSDEVSAGDYNYIRLNRENVLKDYSNWNELNVSDNMKGYLILKAERNALSQLLQTNIQLIKRNIESEYYESLNFRLLPKVSNIIPGYSQSYNQSNTEQVYNTPLNSSVYFRVKPNVDSNSDNTKIEDISLITLGSNKIKLSPEKTDKTISYKDTSSYVCSLFQIVKASSGKNKKTGKYVLMTDGYYSGTKKIEYIDGKIENHFIIRFQQNETGEHLIQVKAVDDRFKDKFIDNLYFTINSKAYKILNNSNYSSDDLFKGNVCINLINEDVNESGMQVYRWTTNETNLDLYNLTLNKTSSEFVNIVKYSKEEPEEEENRMDVKLGTGDMFVNKYISGHKNIGRTNLYVARLINSDNKSFFLFKDGYNSSGLITDKKIPYKNGELESAISIKIEDKSIQIRANMFEFFDTYIDTLFFTLTGEMETILNSSNQIEDNMPFFSKGSVSIKLISDVFPQIYKWQSTQTNMDLYEYSVNKLTNRFSKIIYLDS